MPQAADALTHPAQFALPSGAQSVITQNGFDDGGAMGRGHGVVGTHNS
jgi:hypothetical protein